MSRGKLRGLFFSILLYFLFCSGVSFAAVTDEEIRNAHKEMHKWAPVAGRLYMNNINRVAGLHELVVEFIWDSTEGFGTSEELKNGGEESHAFEMSITFNDKAKGGETISYSDLLECIYTDSLKYNSIAFPNGELKDYEMYLTDCSLKSLVSGLKSSEAEFYVDTRAGDKGSAQDFAFGLNEASKVKTRGADGKPMIYEVKFKVRQQDYRISDAPVVLKVNKLFDIALDLEDGEDDISISDDLDTWYRPRCAFRDFCYANANIEKNGKCAYIGSDCLTQFEDDFKCYTLGREKSCNYETNLNHGLNVLLDTENDRICGDNCNDLSVKRDSPYLAWCLASKDNKYDEREFPASAINVPGKLTVELLQCEDVDWMKIRPEKTGWYDLELPVPQGADFDFTLYYYYNVKCSSKEDTTKEDLKNRRELKEKCSAVFLEEGKEYLLEFSSKAKFYRNSFGGWFTDFTVSYFKPFPDVIIDTSHATAIHTLHLNNVVKGYKNGDFRPDETVNRPQFMKMLIKTISISPHFGTGVFNDQCNCYDPAPAPCSPLEWWERYTNCALGYPSPDKPTYFWEIDKNNFTYEQIGNPLTRGEVAKVLAIAMQLPPSSNSYSKFTDIQGHPYQQEIAQCIDAKIFYGYKDENLFKPNKPITRGEAAEVLVRTYLDKKHRIY